MLVILYAFGTLVAGSSAAAAAFIPLAYTMIPNGGAFLLALLMSVSFASSQLSPTHICTAIISDYFGVRAVIGSIETPDGAYADVIPVSAAQSEEAP